MLSPEQRHQIAVELNKTLLLAGLARVPQRQVKALSHLIQGWHAGIDLEELQARLEVEVGPLLATRKGVKK